MGLIQSDSQGLLCEAEGGMYIEWCRQTMAAVRMRLLSPHQLCTTTPSRDHIGVANRRR